jgi:GNAT superfamily N-acetyltransferase
VSDDVRLAEADVTLRTTPHPLESNLWALNQDFARLPEAVVHDDPDLLWYAVPGTNSWLNGASRSSLGQDAAERVGEAVSTWQGLGMAAMWHQTPSSRPDGLGDILAGHGFVPSLQPGMALMVDRSFAPGPPELVVEAATDAADVRAWVDTFDPAFGVEPRGERHPWLRAFAALYLDETSPGRLFVGRVDGEPVATALAFVGGGAVGIYGVGTLPNRRGHGYGRALTVAGVEWGRRRGARVAVLEASELGFSVYQRLGFETVFPTTSWIRRLAEPSTTR